MKIKYLYLILFVNVIIDSLILAFPQSDSGSLSFRAIIILTQYTLFFLIYFYYRKRVKFINIDITYLINILLLYTLITILLRSTDLQISLNYYFKFCIGFLSFSLGFNLIRSLDEIKKMIHVYVILAFVFSLFLIAFNFLGIGITYYNGATVIAGFSGVESWFGLSIILLIIPFIIKYESGFYKYLSIIIIVVDIIFLILIMRRTNLFIITVGLGMNILFSANKSKNLVILLFVLIALTFIYSIFLNTFLDSYYSRSSKLQLDNLETEGRVVENLLVYQKLSTSAIFMLIGTGDLFNDVGKYGIISSWDLIELTRQLHNDYARIAFGSGFLGLILLLLFYLVLFNKLYKLVKTSKNNIELNELNKIALTLLIIAFFTGFSSGITATGYRTLLLLFLGAVLRINYMLKPLLIYQ
jgi:hypothetical protein